MPAIILESNLQEEAKTTTMSKTLSAMSNPHKAIIRVRHRVFMLEVAPSQLKTANITLANKI